MHVKFEEIMFDICWINAKKLKIRLFSKIRLLGQNSKICLDKNTPRYLEYLHFDFHDSPTSNGWDYL